MARPKSIVTIREVANRAGVSISTVSRVLNNRDGVAEETSQRVRAIIEDLNYTSSLAARSMRIRRTGVLGVVVPDLKSAFCLQVVRGISTALEERGYDLLLYTSGRQADTDRILHEQRHVGLLNGGLTDGTIVLTPHSATFPSDRPVVVVDPHKDSINVPAIISTNYAGAISAMEYLFQLGHRRIGFVAGRPDLQSATRRLHGYRDSLANQGIPFDESLVCAGDFTRETGYACGQHLLSLRRPPTAIFAANDESAIGLMKAARDMGIHIPGELSVIGFDNITESAWTTPPLATVDQSVESLGATAVAVLFDLLDSRSVEPLHKLSTQLIVRESCRAITGDL